MEKNMEIAWYNQLVRINKECFVAVNYYGGIFVFKAELNDETTTPDQIDNVVLIIKYN